MAARHDAAAPAEGRGVGKVCLLTGASAGLGKIAAYQLAREGFHLFLACRSEAKTLPVRPGWTRATAAAAPCT